uniref:Uncharacterized protein n=1 Tax=Arundo donax TaxID=35708 RepID=A0A0A9AFY9_ARUDO
MIEKTESVQMIYRGLYNR